MKNYFIIIFTVFISNVNSQWVLQNTDSSVSLRDISFLNEDTGYSCGNGYDLKLGVHKSYVYKTTNGGTNWTVCFTDTSLQLNAINAVSSQVILTGGERTYSPFEPQMLSSTNNGNSWSYLNIDSTAGPIHSLKFFDNIHLAACIYGLFKSSDNGKSWHKIHDDWGLSDVFFINRNTGWFAAERGNIWKTTNEGLNWELQHDAQKLIAGRSIFFTNINTGYAAYDYLDGLKSRILKTTNSGNSWNIIYSNDETDIYTIDFKNDNTGFMSGVFGKIFKTTNSGIDWEQLNTATTSLLFGLCFLDFNTGYACGTYGTIIKTTTGGVIGINPISTEIPNDFSLEQNYPNPFNPTTNIKFALPKAAFVRLAVYDMLGREVESLVSQQMSPGTYVVDWNAAKFSSGIYMYKLTTTDFNMVKKMSLIK